MFKILTFKMTNRLKLAVVMKNILRSNSAKQFLPTATFCQFPKREIATVTSSFRLCDHFSTKNQNGLLRLRPEAYGYSYYRFSTSKSDEEKKPSLYQRFKLMYKEYWYVLLPVHIATSACWIGGFYYMAVSGVDICALLEMIGAPDSWVSTMRSSKAGGIVTAYTLYKIATPARYTVTLGGTTVTINYLKKWGMIKPMPTKEELKTMYADKKAALKDKVSATTEEIKDEFAKTKNEITTHVKEAKTGFTQSVSETKEGFKEGCREAAEEWRHVGQLVKRNVKEMVKKKEEPYK